MKKILLLEDDDKITSLLKEYLEQFDYRVIPSNRPSDAFRKLNNENDLSAIILDVMLPEENGFSVLKKIRELNTIPVIMLTARGDLTDRVVGLELGADDYLAKPFEPRELLARLGAIIRRSERQVNNHESEDQKTIHVKDLSIQPASRTLLQNGNEIELTAMEFDILFILARNHGSILSRDRITEIIHGDEFEPFNRTIDILISRIRQKLGDQPDQPRYIKTARGIGYQFLTGDKE